MLFYAYSRHFLTLSKKGNFFLPLAPSRTVGFNLHFPQYTRISITANTQIISFTSPRNSIPKTLAKGRIPLPFLLPLPFNLFCFHGVFWLLWAGIPWLLSHKSLTWSILELNSPKTPKAKSICGHTGRHQPTTEISSALNGILKWFLCNNLDLLSTLRSKDSLRVSH